MEGWRRTTIGELENERAILNIQDGNHGEIHPKAVDFIATGGVPFVMAKDIVGGRLRVESCVQLPRSIAEALRIGFARSGDVLLTHKATMGRVAIVPPDLDYVILTPQVTYYRTDHSKLLPHFLKWAFLEPSFQRNLNAISDQSTRKYLGITAQRYLQLQVPPIAEQKAIAEVLGALDDKIEANRRLCATLEALARALFKSWFVDFDPVRAKMEGRDTGLAPDLAALFPDRLTDSPLGPIPEGWEVLGVDKAFKVRMGQSPPGESYNEATKGLPFYQGRSDFGFRFPSRRLFCTAPTRVAKEGDTLLSVRAPVGDLNIAIEECAIGRGLAAVRHSTGASAFTFHALSSMQREFKAFNDTGTVFGAISKSDLPRISFTNPSPSIVDAFEKSAGQLERQIMCLNIQSHSVAHLRDLLIPRLLSGALRVQDVVAAT